MGLNLLIPMDSFRTSSPDAKLEISRILSVPRKESSWAAAKFPNPVAPSNAQITHANHLSTNRDRSDLFGAEVDVAQVSITWR